MATKTLYGMLARKNQEEDSRQFSWTVLPNSTFRIHLTDNAFDRVIRAYGRGQEIGRAQGTGPWVGLVDGPWIKLQDYPSTDLIYERELHVSLASELNGYTVLHIKEGRRFLQSYTDESCIYSLINFVSEPHVNLADVDFDKVTEAARRVHAESSTKLLSAMSDTIAEITGHQPDARQMLEFVMLLEFMREKRQKLDEQ